MLSFMVLLFYGFIVYLFASFNHLLYSLLVACFPLLGFIVLHFLFLFFMESAL